LTALDVKKASSLTRVPLLEKSEAVGAAKTGAVKATATKAVRMVGIFMTEKSIGERR
jgi:hypothetical protein